MSTCGIFLYFVPSDLLLSRKRQSLWYKYIYKRGSARPTSHSLRTPGFRNSVLVVCMKIAESSSVKFKFTQNSGASSKGAPLWFDENIGFCPVCSGSGKVRCFDCNGYGIHPWAVVDERYVIKKSSFTSSYRCFGRLAGGQPCKLCKGARVVSCPVCAPQSYKSLRASVLGISLSKVEHGVNTDNIQEEQDDNWVLQPTGL